MKKIATWLTAGVIVATAAAGCSVTVTDSDGGTNSTGATGGTGGTGGTAGTGGTTGGTAGTGGSSGATGGTGGTADAANDTPVITCTHNPNSDGRCHGCGFSKCNTEHCACNAVSTCKTPMLAFYQCAMMPNANFDDCATTFIVAANPDSSGGDLANDLAGCMDTTCVDTCAGREAGTSNRDMTQSWRVRLGRSEQH
jgi:hypothetical protein